MLADNRQTLPHPEVPVTDSVAPTQSPMLRRLRGGARPWMPVADDAIRAAGLVVMVPIALAALFPLLRQPALQHSWPAVGLTLLFLVHATCTIAIAARLRSRRLLAVLCAVVPVMIWLLLPQRAALVPNDLWAPGIFCLPVVVLVVLTLEQAGRWRWVLAGLALLSVFEVLSPRIGGWTPTRFNLIDSVFLWQPTMAFLLASEGLLRMAHRREQEARLARVARTAHVAQNLESDARREAARLLHDHVLHALHAVARGRNVVTSEQAVAECGAAVEQLFRPTGQEALPNLRDLLDADPLLAEVGVEVSGDAGRLPRTVAEGLSAAVHEAVSNVRKHARATSCTVILGTDGPGVCTVLVRDDGVGFDPSRLPRRRLGLQRSVVERLDDLGGRAVIDSRPGTGTQVRLCWPEEGTNGTVTWSLRGDVDPEVSRALVWSVVPTICVVALMGALIVPLMEPVWLGALMNVGYPVVASGLVWLVRRRPLTVNEARGLVPLTLVPMAVNVWMIPPGQTQLYLYWTAWASGMLLQVMMLCRTSRECVATAVLVTGCMVAFPLIHFGARVTFVHFGNAIIMAAGVPLVTMAGSFVGKAISAQAQDAARARIITQAATAQMHQLARLDHYWSEQVNSETIPLLRRVAAGELDPADPAVRALAAELEISVRDELVLGPAQLKLIESMRRLRAAGWRPNSSLSRDDTAEALGVACELLDRVGEPSFAGQTLNVSATPRAATVVILDPIPAQLGLWKTATSTLGGSMDVYEGFSRIVVPT